MHLFTTQNMDDMLSDTVSRSTNSSNSKTRSNFDKNQWLLDVKKLAVQAIVCLRLAMKFENEDSQGVFDSIVSRLIDIVHLLFDKDYDFTDNR